MYRRTEIPLFPSGPEGNGCRLIVRVVGADDVDLDECDIKIFFEVFSRGGFSMESEVEMEMFSPELQSNIEHTIIYGD